MKKKKSLLLYLQLFTLNMVISSPGDNFAIFQYQFYQQQTPEMYCMGDLCLWKQICKRGLNIFKFNIYMLYIIHYN